MFHLPVLEENHKKDLCDLVFSCEIYRSIDTKKFPSLLSQSIQDTNPFHLCVFDEENVHN